MSLQNCENYYLKDPIHSRRGLYPIFFRKKSVGKISNTYVQFHSYFLSNLVRLKKIVTWDSFAVFLAPLVPLSVLTEVVTVQERLLVSRWS